MTARVLAALFSLSIMCLAHAEQPPVTPLSHPASLHPALSAALCRAAAEDSALAPQMEAMLESGLISYDQVGDVLNLDCQSRSLLERVVAGQHAENLEYLAIDLGLDIDQPQVQMGVQLVSFIAFLEARAVQAEPALKAFINEYLAYFRDAEFNPNLALSMY
ncbi:hypothetical protein K8B33_12610 [Alcanivorax sp. JB21]|uniref:hypothetical protein n=1 Tax=Alcanivorax limicola TaxID=2874102 RepID=UPI001CBE2F83|nr:hypothetical protein [Alcanivorax limicola]MBZ2189944.1 hypothetical protein [Alcanivorax limicola]